METFLGVGMFYSLIWEVITWMCLCVCVYAHIYVVIGVCTFLYICYTSIKNSFEKCQVSKPGKRVHFSDEGKNKLHK